MFRIGVGYDVHKLVPGRKLILGGIDIPYESGLLGHSDADVLTHALIDALIGALGSGDIGKHFPDTDMKYKDISSMTLLAHAKRMLDDAGYKIGNVDMTVVAQAPKLAPHIPQIRKKLADVLECPPESVNVKAKTTEGLGFEGEKQGISAHAVVLITKHLNYN